MQTVSDLYEVTVSFEDARAAELYASLPVLIDWYQREQSPSIRRHLRYAALAALEELEDHYAAPRQYLDLARGLLTEEEGTDATH